MPFQPVCHILLNRQLALGCHRGRIGRIGQPVLHFRLVQLGLPSGGKPFPRISLGFTVRLVLDVYIVHSPGLSSQLTRGIAFVFYRSFLNCHDFTPFPAVRRSNFPCCAAKPFGAAKDAACGFTWEIRPPHCLFDYRILSVSFGSIEHGGILRPLLCSKMPLGLETETLWR